jgi:hypothetical protein
MCAGYSKAVRDSITLCEDVLERHRCVGERFPKSVRPIALPPARDPVWQTMWSNRPTPRDGWFDAGSEAGFGILLDEDMLERYRVG